MTLDEFKIWLHGYGEGVGLSADNAACIYNKVASLDKISSSAQSSSGVCFHLPNVSCPNCCNSLSNSGYVQGAYNSKNDDPLGMHYKYTLPEDR